MNSTDLNCGSANPNSETGDGIARRYPASAMERTVSERRLCDTIGCRHAVASRNASCAMAALLEAIGVGKGDEVLVSCLTAPDLLAAIRRVGAEPVAVDVEPATLQMCAAAAEQSVTRRTRALLLTHTNGISGDIRTLRTVAACNRLELIEDCTEALGVQALGRPLGLFGCAGILRICNADSPSAYDAPGAVITDSPRLAHDLCHRDDIESRSRNLPDGDLINALSCNALADPLRRSAAASYRVYLDNLEEVGLPAPCWQEAPAAPKRFVIRVPDQHELVSRLRSKGIDACPLRISTVLKPETGQATDELGRRIPGGFAIAQHGVTLPISPELGEKLVLTVCLHIRIHYAERRLRVRLAESGLKETDLSVAWTDEYSRRPYHRA